MVELEISCLKKRERERAKKKECREITSSLKYTAYSCAHLISGSEDKLHRMLLVTFTALLRTYTPNLHNNSCAHSQKILVLFVSQPLCTCKSTPYILNTIFPLMTFPFWSVFCNIFSPVQQKATDMIDNACMLCWLLAYCFDVRRNWTRGADKM